MRNGKIKTWSIMMSALGIVSIASGVALAQVGNPTFTDNPSPFPYVHTGVGGSGTQLTGGQLITFQGTMGSGNFFQQEFVNIDPDGPGGAGPEAAIHTMLEGASTGKAFVQESFVLLSGQRPPTIQNNTPSPIVPPPGHTQISFRQSVKDNGFSTTASLDPGQDIHIHQQNASPDPVNGQSGGLTFSNVDILPNRTGPNGPQEGSDPSCGTTATFCTTIDQQVRVTEGATVIFTQDMDFTTGGLPTIVQGP
ncbi:hypothetical protein [Candidatus Manganitrophus noduliformans]|uniref:CHRD domain-containing protein n=1 Tax=Candidatus Manganitrophus noduliformans TaxID=2606439 RepID=A0A7X6DPB4_9BACT|nr:hypothetical protein [Candidatus Manganitrophus noduliformans]NKE70891.1 hypothetical protein [Candidatus Manganitrophus noduliformans]